MKNFDLNLALNKNTKIVTRNGNRVEIICVSRDKIVANVYPANKLGGPRQTKYNLDGSRYSPSYEHFEDLFLVA